jgi:hypothetical protein
MGLRTDGNNLYALTSPGLHVAQVCLSDNEYENVHRLKDAFGFRAPEFIFRSIEKCLNDLRKVKARAHCASRCPT